MPGVAAYCVLQGCYILQRCQAPKMGVTGKCFGGKGYRVGCITAVLQRVGVPGTEKSTQKMELGTGIVVR